MATNHDMSDQHDADPAELTQGLLMQGLRLAAITLASAVVTATIIIGAGGVWLQRPGQPVGASAETSVPLIRTSG